MHDIIDAHCHIYPEAVALRAIEAVDKFYDGLPAVPMDGTAASLLQSADRYGIGRCLVHSVATRPRQVSSINRFIANAVGDAHGRFIGMGTMHLESDDLRRDFEELRSLGLHGIKLHPDIQKFHIDDPRAMYIFEMCEAVGLPVCAHTGDYRFDYSNPNRVVRVLRAFPKLKFIGAHFAGWSVWDDAAKTLSGYDNIVVDASSTCYMVGKQRMRELIDIWTPRRVLFGTDYPMWTPELDLDALNNMDLPESDLESIFHKNAEALFGL